jgi:hypothetical protein
MAQMRSPDPSEICLVIRVDRKWLAEGQNDAIDAVDDARSRHRMCKRVIDAPQGMMAVHQPGRLMRRGPGGV